MLACLHQRKLTIAGTPTAWNPGMDQVVCLSVCLDVIVQVFVMYRVQQNKLNR